MGSDTSTSAKRRDDKACEIREWIVECSRKEVRDSEAGVSRIAEGVEEASLLVVWKVLPSGDRRTDACVAVESTSERFAECDDDEVAGVYSTVRLRGQACARGKERRARCIIATRERGG